MQGHQVSVLQHATGATWMEQVSASEVLCNGHHGSYLPELFMTVVEGHQADQTGEEMPNTSSSATMAIHLQW